MLDLPSRPAVAYFHAWAPRRMGFAFYDSPEEMIDVVPEYYGLPSISMRNALYHVSSDKIVPDSWLWRQDPTHANCLGHRCTFAGVMPHMQGPPKPALVVHANRHHPHALPFASSAWWAVAGLNPPTTYCWVVPGWVLLAEQQRAQVHGGSADWVPAERRAAHPDVLGRNGWAAAAP